MSAFCYQRFSISVFVSRQLPQRSTATRAALPAMSLAPVAPFSFSKRCLDTTPFLFSDVSVSVFPRFSFSKRCLDTTPFLFPRLLGGSISPDRKLPSGKPGPPCKSGQLKKDLGLEVSSARHAARLVIFEIMRSFLFVQIAPVPNGTTQDRWTPLPVRDALARGAGKRAVDTLLINFYRRGLPR